MKKTREWILQSGPRGSAHKAALKLSRKGVRLRGFRSSANPALYVPLLLFSFLIVSLSACGEAAQTPTAPVDNFEEPEEITPRVPDEMALLESTSQIVCLTPEPNPFESPTISSEGSVFVLDCVFAAGHATSVRIDRYDSAAAAVTAFDREIEGQAVMDFHGYPSAEWEEALETGDPQARVRFFQWQMGRWTIKITSTDDTVYRIAAVPREAAEVVNEQASEAGFMNNNGE